MSAAKEFEGRRRSASASIVLAFVIAGAASSAACHGSHSAPRANSARALPPLSVEATTIRAGNASGVIRIAAVAEPAHRTALATNLMARVVDVRVVEGQRVRQGDGLLRLDVRSLAAQRGQAQAAASANEAQAELATAGLRRTRVLEQSGAVTTQQREIAETTLAAYEASVRGAGAALRAIDVNLGESVLKAPFDGVVVQRQTEVGSFAAPGQPLLLLEDDSALRIVAPIAAADASRITQGSSYDVSFATGEQARGVLDAVVSSGTPRSPGLVAIFVVENAERRLRSGVVASVAIPAPPTGSTAFEVPEGAVFARGGLRGVFVVRDGVAEVVWCSIDARARTGRITVLDGLREGDIVVDDAHLPGLRDGRRVVVAR